MLTDEQLSNLLSIGISAAQVMLTEWCKRQIINIGDTVYCRVQWPKQHKDEHFLFLAPQPDGVLQIVALNEHAHKRVNQSLELFTKWQQLQQWHEQFAFTLQTNVQVTKRANQSGLVLLH